MEVIIDILLAIGKVLIHMIEPLIWLGMGFWKWWTTELPEVLTYEEEPPSLIEPQERDMTKTQPETYYIIWIVFLCMILFVQMMN